MLVLDTNLWISYALLPGSELGRRVEWAIRRSPYAFSKHTFTEFTDVLMRPKFDRYVSTATRAGFLRTVAERAAWFTPDTQVHDCRDIADNKFLELALSAGADHILTGDDDLLVLHPYRNIGIVTLNAYADSMGFPAG